MNDIYKNIEEYHPNKKNKIFIVIDDMLSNLIVTELFIRGRKLNISPVFTTQSYFAVPKSIRLNSTHYFALKIQNKQELQQTTFNHSSEIDFKGFINLYEKCTAKPYSFLVIYTTLASYNLSHFRKNLLERIEKLIMTMDNKIRDEKLENDITREALINMNMVQVK